MNKEIEDVINNLQLTLHGEPWFGRAVFPLLEEVEESIVYIRPDNKEHSLIELLYHMITWAEFCLSQLENASPEKIKEVESRDWRKIDPAVHSWKNGMMEFSKIHAQIQAILITKTDEFLSETVPGRKFNFRFMLNGLIHHNLYHLGQVAYVKKLLS